MSNSVLENQVEQYFPFPRKLAPTSLSKFYVYIGQHLPKEVAFTLNHQRYILPIDSIGLVLEITLEWCKRKGLLERYNISLRLTELFEEILAYKQEGLAPLKRKVTNGKIGMFLWLIGRWGDGIVWPNAFRDIVIR